MNKVCIVCSTNIYLTPYLKKYEEILNNGYDIIYWNRNNIPEKTNADMMYSFNYEGHKSRFSKLFGFIKFRKYLLKILRKNNYSKIIVLNIQIGILIKSYLVKKYRNNYLVDIRDYTFENNKFYYNIEKSLVKNSGLNIISSQAFLNFLPQADYIVVHNNSQINQKTIKQYRSKNRPNNKIIISNIGLIRFYDQLHKFILTFKNDQRFELRFFGKGANELKSFCLENDVHNVILKDQFDPSETIKFFYESDVVFNLYGNNTPLLDYALSNKLYYAAQFGMPILVCPNTYMETISQTYGFGYSVNYNENNIPNSFYEYYKSIQWDIFYQNCDEFINKVNNENMIFLTKVKDFIKN